jgi:hypothetical protein
MNPLNNHLSEQDEQRLGVAHENLEGWVPELATESEVHEAIEKAFDYRGDLTLTLKDGRVVIGYLFDRKIGGPCLTDCFVRVMPKDSSEKLKIPYSDIAGIAFTGRDTAAGKSFATWGKKYNEKKALGETNIGIEAESLEE